METERQETMGASGEDLAGLLKTLLTPADAAVLTGEFAGYLAWTGREGLASGSQGWWDDGHLTLITNRIGEVHVWLAEGF
jgi:hypothetical protein